MRVVMTDDLVSGTSNRGKLSPVRRFFVLLCTFDVLFICLLWIISVLVTGRDLVQELHQQVGYNLEREMKDWRTEGEAGSAHTGLPEERWAAG